MRQRYILLSVAFLGLAGTPPFFSHTASSAQSTSSTKASQKANKPLAGFHVIVIEPFTIEKGEPTKNFPPGKK